ncbi:MAG: RNA polymerase sigma-70 factor [Flavisolibacter sp.]|nr:RNA polymerase sigma-70 factor [Flavisolibacter sp.]
MRIALSEDMQAYKELYLLMYPNLHRFCYSFTRSKEAAEEVVSDVFIKLWQIRSQLSSINNLRVYLYRITKNLSLNYLAQASRNPAIQSADIDIESSIDFRDPEDLYISKETIQKIKLIIQELPPQCKIIFFLVREHGLTYKEVADILTISVFTVRNQLAIATKKIAEAISSGGQVVLRFNDRFSAS